MPRDEKPASEPPPLPVDTDPGAALPPEILDGEDTDPGPAPDPLDHEEETYLREEASSARPSDPPESTEELETREAAALRDEAPPEREAASEAGEEDEEEESKLPRLPWGQILVVAIYVFFGGSFLLYEHVSSEGAVIHRHMRAADALLGERMGAASSTAELIEAAEHYLAVLALDKHVELAQRRMDLIVRRLEERRASLPQEMARRHSAISSRAKIEKAQARKGLFSDLPITPAERFGLLDHRARVRRNAYIFFGVLVAMVGWMVITSSLRRLNTREARGPEDTEDDGRFIS